jgi:hypothetical protein
VIDLVRAGVSFRSLTDLKNCLEKIKFDSRVVVLQIKNRFHPSVAGNAGYRNLALSIAVVDEHTMSHAVDEHVCEYVPFRFRCLPRNVEPSVCVPGGSVPETETDVSPTDMLLPALRLQLGLADLDEKKSAGGHRRYVHWRNLQAE